MAIKRILGANITHDFVQESQAKVTRFKTVYRLDASRYKNYMTKKVQLHIQSFILKKVLEIDKN